MWGPFAPGGIPFGPSPCMPILPQIGCKQFNLNAKLWYATLNASTVAWGTSPGGNRPTELDLHDDLGLGGGQLIAEYEGRFQIRRNWGVRFSFMPISYREDNIAPHGFWWGNVFYPATVPIVTDWKRNIGRADLVYDWFKAPYAVSSVFAGYSLYDDKITISAPTLAQSRTRSRGFGLVRAGMSLERYIARVGCAGGVASINCNGAIQACEGYVGYDLYGAGRISVPMGYGRFGYLEAGWRWMVLDRSYPTDVDRTSLDGVIGAVGLVF